MAASEVTVTLRMPRWYLLALRLACGMATLSLRAVVWLADHPRVVVR